MLEQKDQYFPLFITGWPGEWRSRLVAVQGRKAVIIHDIIERWLTEQSLKNMPAQSCFTNTNKYYKI